MAWITEKMRAIWESGQFIGANTPHTVVQVQLGQWRRGWYRVDEMVFPDDATAEEWDHVHALIYGEGGYGHYGGGDAWPGHWSAKWEPDTGLYTLPNVASVKRTRDLNQNGVTVLEVTVDAQDYVPKTGALGDAYHALIPGWLSPTRNYVAPGRPTPAWQQPAELAGDTWAPLNDDGTPKQGRIQDSVMIRVWQGYGPPETDDSGTPPLDGGTNGAWTFRGMIDDVDLDGDPNSITITARNGKLLTDQRVFRASKSPQIADPVTFYDNKAAMVLVLVGSGATASSASPDHKPINVLDHPHHMWNIADDAYSTEWHSNANITAEDLEWVEIRLPQGHYTDFWLCAPAGLTCFVGIYARQLHWVPDTGVGLEFQGTPPTRDGVDIAEGWVGGGGAPGANGGWPYIHSFETGSTLPHDGDVVHGDLYLDRPSLQNSYELGQHSILRVGFLREDGSTPAPARVADLHGIRRVVDKEIEKQQYILVDDASEIVKVVLRWAGYLKWNVEEALVRLSDGTTTSGGGVVSGSSGRLLFNRSQTLLEIVQEVAKQLGFVFFIADPVDGDSDGVPTFRRSSSYYSDVNYIAADVSDQTMLTGLKVKHTDEPKAAVIRVRGKTASARGGGVPLGWDLQSRIMCAYFPPWWFGARMGGVLRHIVYQDDQFITFAQCLFAAMLIALDATLEMHTAICEIPSHPMIELDNHVSIIDEPTATNSRLWIVKTEDTMVLGQNASWKMTLEGSLIDSRDFHDVVAQLEGNQPITIGSKGSEQEVIDSIDWNRVVDPFTGDASGYNHPPITRAPATIWAQIR